MGPRQGLFVFRHQGRSEYGYFQDLAAFSRFRTKQNYMGII